MAYGNGTRRKSSGSGLGLSAVAGAGRQEGTGWYEDAPGQPDRTAGVSRPSGKPRGRDTDIWRLAVLFRWHAQRNRIELTKGLPVIAAEINDLVTRFEMRGRDTIRSYPHMVTGCRRYALMHASRTLRKRT